MEDMDRFISAIGRFHRFNDRFSPRDEEPRRNWCGIVLGRHWHVLVGVPMDLPFDPVSGMSGALGLESDERSTSFKMA